MRVRGVYEVLDRTVAGPAQSEGVKFLPVTEGGGSMSLPYTFEPVSSIGRQASCYDPRCQVSRLGNLAEGILHM